MEQFKQRAVKLLVLRPNENPVDWLESVVSKLLVGDSEGAWCFIFGTPIETSPQLARARAKLIYKSDTRTQKLIAFGLSPIVNAVPIYLHLASQESKYSGHVGNETAVAEVNVRSDLSLPSE